MANSIMNIMPVMLNPSGIESGEREKKLLMEELLRNLERGSPTGLPAGQQGLPSMIPSSQIPNVPTGLPGAIPGSQGASAPVYAESGAFSTKNVIEQLLEQLMNDSQQARNTPLADLSSVLGSFSSGEKANRIIEGSLRGNFDNMMLDRETQKNRIGLDAQTGRNLNEADALKKLQQTAYIGGGGSQMGPMNIMLNGQNRQLPQFSGIAPQRTTAAEQAGAKDLQGQVMERMKPGGSFQPEWNYEPKSIEEYATPGLLEDLSSYGAAGTGLWGTATKVPGVTDLLGKGVKTAGGYIADIFGKWF